MPLFQKSVLKKHLLDLNTAELDAAFQRYSAYFHNATIQQNIRNAKEEQFQEGFLRELFGTVLNYTLNPNPNFNLTTELKNTTNSKKADGAILVDEKAVAVIELKGTDTTDLNKIETQAFGYKNNQAECNYVITSNFEKLRFYIDNTIDFEEFNLFTLTRDQFNLLYLCLSYDNIKNNIPKRLKAESVSQEDQITKKLYKDYSEFKRALFTNLVELNPQYDKLLLFKKTQKLLDRFLFIFFAEDTNLLPTNLIFRINKEWKNLQEMRIPVSLYERYLVYFNDLNHGAKVTLPAFGKKTGEAITAEFEIFAYNGGLFLPDEVLDNVKIDDTLLHTYSEKLSHYDFDSDVDVNILGHIFENSLNEIDEIKSEIEGTAVDKTKTKRKKDGVFYTPKYITKYIVDNTVGKLCTEKKAELKLLDEYYTSDKKLQTKTKKALLDKLAEYRAWLLQLTICDPACGSGAFLNQALEFLIAEHRYVDELQAKLMGDAMILSDIETSILENNIYGVDLNDESVEIAKLSLWLRTAQKGRKLNSLNKNIKCGNSLIDDPAVAGEKAFSWEKEFPEVFAKGGFDVVIGNPPYVRQELIGHDNKDWLISNYQTGNGTADLYIYFYEKAIDCLKDSGILGFITPNKFYKTKYGHQLREYLTSKEIIELVDFFELPVFQDASTDSQIILLKNIDSNTEFYYHPIKTLNSFIHGDYESITINKKQLHNDIWVFKNSDDNRIILKLSKGSISLGEYVQNEIYLGVKTAANNAFIIDSNVRRNLIEQDEKSAELIKKYVAATDIKKYHLENKDEFYLINTGYDTDLTKYPAIFNWLLQFDEQLKNRTDKGKHHFNLRACNYYPVFEKPKIIYIYTAVNHCFKYDENGVYVNNSCFIIGNADKFLSGILNSRVFNYYKRLNFVAYGDAHSAGRVKLDLNKMKNVPIPLANLEQKQLFENQVEKNSILSESFYSQKQTFLKFLSASFNILNYSTKLQNWHDLIFPDFIKELNKTIKASGGSPLTKKDEFEWMELFEENKKKAVELKAQIDQTDKEIDAMVYELYGLSEEEIGIVENS